ncbi:hypothetical protein KXX13_001188 [Aspergillus fumigatus]|nr:hypothetical protein CNMCM8714_002123 [Aspergillus fumigatus]KAH1307731.1 hypothetical protein KXX11_000506 [Aspergillus fumigatus]KAH1424491.1 hypothetical protein KXX32_006880 [Aspergillus fumigatus]KAH1466492.1 hypothetical protein KXX13_001188 [Aspergillus fumigatus]KAH1512261.1 hypothetical protein KXX29_002860 [Aspergillus fumigatus]
MFLENYSRSLVGLLGCMALVQQGYSACIPSVSRPSTSKGNIMIPWYMYPAGGAWTSMEKLISSNPDVQFTIIINPDNGSGPTALPDENFLAAVPRLTAYSNALVIGYVRTDKGTRDISEVKKEIDTYEGWPSASGNPSFAVHGTFLDEAPSEYDAAAVEYFQQLASSIRGSNGLGPNNHVVMNPGTVPDAAYLGIPDTTVIFESPYSEFVRAVSSDQFQGIKGQDLSRFASMVYDVPDNVDLENLLSQLRAISSQTYLSNLNTYQAFDSVWTKVVSLLSA